MRLSGRRRSRLSVVVVVHDMVEQAMRTLTSLSPAHQRGTAPGDYEVLVVENESDRMLDPEAVRGFGERFRYLRRTEPSSSPVAACNAGLAAARGSHIALMIDGARMVTPGTVATALQAARAFPGSPIVVPGYHLGSMLQRDPRLTGHDETAEAGLLAGIGWPDDGYRLFEIAVFSGSCAAGFLVPISESNFLTLPAGLWSRLGGVDQRFQSPGGGFANLDLYRRACLAAATGPVVLAGEGTFHQFHAGVTTGDPTVDREALLVAMAQEYQQVRGAPFTPPGHDPVLFGAVGAGAARFLAHSAERLRG